MILLQFVCAQRISLPLFLILFHRAHLRRRQYAMTASSLTFTTRAKVSARRVATAHVPRVSSERAHVLASRTDIHATHAPISAAPICITAAGHVKASVITTSATGAHTTATLANTDLDAAARVQDHAQAARMRRRMPRTRPRDPSIRTIVSGNACRISTTMTASA